MQYVDIRETELRGRAYHKEFLHVNRKIWLLYGSNASVLRRCKTGSLDS